MNRVLIIANWKCNPPAVAEAKKLFLQVKKGASRRKMVETVICPPFVFLPFLAALLRKGKNQQIKLGAQDAFWQEGSFTGQVSAKMIKSLGCKYAIIGHSEQRAMGETNEEINKKLKACLGQGLRPIFCIGESSQEREEDKTFQVLKNQIKEGLKDINRNQAAKIVIAYEPIWAIGTGNNCAYDEAMSMNLLIKKNLAGLYNYQLAKKVRIIYGGSVNSVIVEDYIKESMMDGALVGGASLSAKEFIAILRKF